VAGVAGAPRAGRGRVRGAAAGLGALRRAGRGRRGVARLLPAPERARPSHQPSTCASVHVHYATYRQQQGSHGGYNGPGIRADAAGSLTSASDLLHAIPPQGARKPARHARQSPACPCELASVRSVEGRSAHLPGATLQADRRGGLWGRGQPSCVATRPSTCPRHPPAWGRQGAVCTCGPQPRRGASSFGSGRLCGGRPQCLWPAMAGAADVRAPPRGQAAAVAAAFGRAEVTALAWLHLVLLDLAQARRAPTLTLTMHPPVIQQAHCVAPIEPQRMARCAHPWPSLVPACHAAARRVPPSWCRRMLPTRVTLIPRPSPQSAAPCSPQTPDPACPARERARPRRGCGAARGCGRARQPPDGLAAGAGQGCLPQRPQGARAHAALGRAVLHVRAARSAEPRADARGRARLATARAAAPRRAAAQQPGLGLTGAGGGVNGRAGAQPPRAGWRALRFRSVRPAMGSRRSPSLEEQEGLCTSLVLSFCTAV